MSKLEDEKARKAGGALRLAAPGSLPAEALADPIGACPFEEGDPQRVQWLEGFKEAHEQAAAFETADVGAALKKSARAAR